MIHETGPRWLATHRGLWSAVTLTLLCSSPASAYKVWLGTHEWPASSLANKGDWDKVAARIEGLNYVLSPNNTDPASADQWRHILGVFDPALPGMAEIARSQVAPAGWRTLSQRLNHEFVDLAKRRGYEINTLMLYDEAKNDSIHEWTLEEIRAVRSWLDSSGHKSVKIAFNLRNFSLDKRLLVRNPLVDEILIEASATRWVENRFNLHALLQELWTRSDTKTKTIYFQIPRSESANNQYVETRRALMTIKNLMGNAFMRSPQVVFLICNYSSNLPFFPETRSKEAEYVNSSSGIALSLLEQRDVFEGRAGVLDEAFCASYSRLPGATTHVGSKARDSMRSPSIAKGTNNRVFVLGRSVRWEVYSPQGTLLRKGYGGEMDLRDLRRGPVAVNLDGRFEHLVLW